MRGLTVLTALLLLAIGLGLVVAWPSHADLDRARLELNRTIRSCDEALGQVADDYHFIVERKPANRVKTMLEADRRRIALIRHRAKRLGEESGSDVARQLDQLAELRQQAEEIAADARTLRGRTGEIRSTLVSFAPILREIAALRERLSALEVAAARAGNLTRVRDIRAAIESSSTKEELVTKAFEAFTSDTSTGRVLAQTARNELTEIRDHMRHLVGP